MTSRNEDTLESRLGNAADPQKLDAQPTGIDRIEHPRSDRPQGGVDPDFPDREPDGAGGEDAPPKRGQP
jgi:hypothetical protein